MKTVQETREYKLLAAKQEVERKKLADKHIAQFHKLVLKFVEKNTK
jgi:hypothetical protein